MALFFYLGVILLLLSPLFVAGYMLGQIDKAARRQRAPVKIWLVDLFSLVFLIQIPLALISRWQTEMEIGPLIAIVLLFCGIMTLVWWTTIKTVSRAGITSVFWRSAISLFVIPMAFVGSFAIMIITLGLADGQAGLWFIDSVLVLMMACSILIVKRAIFVARSPLKQDRSEDSVAPRPKGRLIRLDD